MPRCALPALAALSLAFAPAPVPRPDPVQAARRTLQGTWVLVRHAESGREVDAGATKVVFAGDRVKFIFQDVASSEYVYTLDATREPRTFDHRQPDSDYTWWGIYQLRGDTLIIHARLGKSAADRPTDFNPTREGVSVQVFRRKKP